MSAKHNFCNSLKVKLFVLQAKYRFFSSSSFDSILVCLLLSCSFFAFINTSFANSETFSFLSRKFYFYDLDELTHILALHDIHPASNPLLIIPNENTIPQLDALCTRSCALKPLSLLLYSRYL